MADDGKLTAELAAIKERAQAATPGPWGTGEDKDAWRLSGDLDTGFRPPCLIEAPKYSAYGPSYWPGEADSAFIVAARTDVPRLVKALEAALNHHQPEQLYGMVEDYKGNVACPHGPGYDGDLHYEADDGFWYCKALPTVIVCSSCADGSASDLREQWPCPTYTAIARELTGEPE